jgi:hypothetical protein
MVIAGHPKYQECVFKASYKEITFLGKNLILKKIQLSEILGYIGLVRV